MHENTLLGQLLRAHLTLAPGEALKHHELREYVDAAERGTLTVLLKKERTPVGRPWQWQWQWLISLAGRAWVADCVLRSVGWWRRRLRIGAGLDGAAPWGGRWEAAQARSSLGWPTWRALASAQQRLLWPARPLPTAILLHFFPAQANAPQYHYIDLGQVLFKQLAGKVSRALSC